MSSRILFYRCSGSSVGTDSRRLWVNSCSDLCALVELQPDRGLLQAARSPLARRRALASLDSIPSPR